MFLIGKIKNKKNKGNRKEKKKMTSPIKNREEKMLASHWSIILTCYEIDNISKFIA